MKNYCATEYKSTWNIAMEMRTWLQEHWLNHQKTERDNKMKKIKNLGAFKYNLKVIAAQKGNLIVARRPSKKTFSAKHFLPCLHCYGFYCKKELWRHTKKCPLNTNKSCDQHQVISRSQLLLSGGLSSCSFSNEVSIPTELQETVFTKMR